MPYVTAVQDRTYADIVALNSKAYFNVADWVRIYGNSQLVSGLAEIMLGETVAFVDLTAPTTITIPAVADFNTFLANIETLRLAVETVSIPGTSTEIKDDWEAGTDKPSPAYTHANLWESTLDAIWEYFDGGDLEVCPTLTADLTVTTGNTKIYVDCLDAGGFNITVEDGATLAIIP